MQVLTSRLTAAFGSKSVAVICKCQRSMASSAMKPREVTLPVPWGQVAGKAWGEPGGKPVLALHGWLDNAGSFDNLIPLLSKELYVVAVDWPGHGMSSHLPNGAQYDAFGFVANVKHIVDALKWDKFSLLAHSMGGGAATWYTGALPEKVESLVLLDALGFWAASMEELPKLTGHALKTLSNFDRPDTRTYSSWDTVLDRIVQGHIQMDGLFDRISAGILANRGTRQLEDGSWKFTRDLRAKAPSVVKVSKEVNNVYIQAIESPTLLVLYAGEVGGEDRSPMAKKIGESLSGPKNSQIRVVEVPGGHHMHLHSPQALHPLISSFLLHQTIPPQFKEVSKL